MTFSSLATQLKFRGHNLKKVFSQPSSHGGARALGRQRQVDLCEFESSLLYRGSSRTVRTTERNPVSGGKRFLEFSNINIVK